MSHTKNKSGSPRFKVGDKVRVKPGISDPDFPDMPLGGWSGTVTEIIEHKGQINCVFELDERTLASIHPIYKQRCEIDGLDYQFMGLGQEEIGPDDGTPVPIEQPTAIVPRPLSPDDQDDRVRRVFGLTHDDPLPEVGHETLLSYHHYLAARLKFPLFTTYRGESGPFSRKKMTVTITGLLDPEGDDSDEGYGLLCRGLDRDEQVELPLDEIEVDEEDPNFRLVTDYSYWFHNWR
jgi:Calcium binding